MISSENNSPITSRSNSLNGHRVESLATSLLHTHDLAPPTLPEEKDLTARRHSCIGICVHNAERLSRSRMVICAPANSDHEDGLCEACILVQPGSEE
jgi:hypothetical protein